MNLRASIAATLGTLTFLIPTLAAAQDQPWLKDRRYTEGIGIRVGDVELHPGIAGEVGYDTNYFHRASEEDPVGSIRFRITPSFSLSTLSRQRREVTPDAPPPDFEFRAGIAATYDEFIPVSGPDEGQELMSEQRNIGGLLDLHLKIAPQRPWSGAIDADIGRTISPSDEGLTEASFNRINAGAGGELIWTPGGGLLDWRLGYKFRGTIFESSEFEDLTNMQHTLQTRGRWRFLPRTAAIYDASFGFLSYPEGDKAGHPLRAQLGINGLVTPYFGMLAMAGWGASFYTPTGQNDFDSVIGQLELKYYLTPNPSTDPAAAGLALSSIAGGFIRDFHDSYLGTYFERDRLYLKFTYFFSGQFLMIAEGGAGAHVYPDIPAGGALETDTAGWTELRADASLFGEWRIKDSIGINATLRYGGNFTDKSITVPDPDEPGGTSQNRLKWQQFEAFLGARWFM